MARSTIGPPPRRHALGNVAALATIRAPMISPLKSACTVDPMLALVAARKPCVAIPGRMVTGAAAVRASCPSTELGRHADDAAGRHARSRSRTCSTSVPSRWRYATRWRASPDGPLVPVVSRALISSLEEALAVQLAQSRTRQLGRPRTAGQAVYGKGDGRAWRVAGSVSPR